MYNLAEAGKNSAIRYWESTPTEFPHYLNGFNGTWAISDHSRIPEVILEFLLEHFRSRLGEVRKGHVKAIPLNEINDLLNSVWEGPGSMPKIVELTYKMRQNRLETDPIDTKDVMKGYIIPTFDSNLGKSAVDKLEE